MICTRSHPKEPAHLRGNEDPLALYTAKRQASLIHLVVEESRRVGRDEMGLGRQAVPNISALPDCLERRFRSGYGIFGCYGSWAFRNRQSTIKSMHHTMACPSTDFHHACSRTCICGKRFQQYCSLLHMRPLHAYHTRGDADSLQRSKQMYGIDTAASNSLAFNVSYMIELEHVWNH